MPWGLGPMGGEVAPLLNDRGRSEWESPRVSPEA